MERLGTLVDSWVLDLRAQGRSPATIKSYRTAVHLFETWLGREGTAEDLTRSNIRLWVAHEMARTSPSSAALRYRCLRAFGTWLVEEEVLSTPPTHRLREPRVPETAPRLIPASDLDLLLSAVRGKDYMSVRDNAIIRFLSDTGVRAAELVALRAEDLDLVQGSAVVRVGKGGKSRQVWYGGRTARALDRYLRQRTKRPNHHSPALWLTSRGHGQPLTTNGIREILRKRSRLAGIPAVHPHDFRHTLAHDWMAAGYSDRALKVLMGWSTDAMLEVYGRSARVERARDAVGRFHTQREAHSSGG